LELSQSTTLWRRWNELAQADPDRDAVVHWDVLEGHHRWSRASLIEAATHMTRRLSEAGVRRGDVCALIIRHHPRFYPLYFAVEALGAIPSVLAYPNPRLHPDKFVEGLRGMAERSGLGFILTERELSDTVTPLVTHAASRVRQILFPLEWDTQPAEPRTVGLEPDHDPDETRRACLLQHSSGTTGLQKAVVLSHRAVLEHAQRYARAIDLGPRDRVVSWLPLYHDMGLIAAFHVPLALGVPVVQMSPFQWVQAPGLLFNAISEEKGTLTWLPNFAYNFLADRVQEDELDGIDLSSMRLFVNCSEPVRAESHEKFLNRFASIGVRAEALGASYAMAETTFAVTQTAPGREARRLRVDRDALSAGWVRLATEGSARVCVSSGAPLAGCEIRVVDPDGRDVAPDVVGELSLRSVSMFDGYCNQPEKTAEVLKDGWYFSGDYGFVHEGEAYVVGRKKDLIIVAGKNIYPEDVEEAVSQVEGVVPGRVVAFGVDDPELGSERVSVIVESAAATDAERVAIRRAIIEAAMAIDITLAAVHFVPPRWLIKSSSGKPSRRANKERILAGEAGDSSGGPE
jgi:acyl-CoA synthetase (AMP-forming)/AMP-acid ligase II